MSEEEKVKLKLMNEIIEEVEVPTSIEEEEGTYDLWVVDIDKDKDGIELESPDDIDINGLSDRRMLRALFQITKETPVSMLKAIMGSTTGYELDGFELVRAQPSRIEFDEGRDSGVIKFNCKVQQLRNILFHRRTNFVYVLGTLD